jgi:hypothetical protein
MRKAQQAEPFCIWWWSGDDIGIIVDTPITFLMGIETTFDASSGGNQTIRAVRKLEYTMVERTTFVALLDLGET